jgi:hypothetical protein
LDVKCPVCDRTISSGRIDDLSSTLGRHLYEEHGFTVPETAEERQVRTFSGPESDVLTPEERMRREEVAQFKGARVGEAPEERAVETFSEREPYGGTMETRREVEKVTQFKNPREVESVEECKTRTFSDTECAVQPEETKLLKEEVRQWVYPRVGPRGERGPAFLCPVCGTTMAASDEESLSAELKGHFVEVHQVEMTRVEMRR